MSEVTTGMEAVRALQDENARRLIALDEFLTQEEIAELIDSHFAARITALEEALRKLFNDCCASDFNEHWESYTEAACIAVKDAVSKECRRVEGERDRLQAAIRNHRDQHGDDRCWMDDEELYKVLAEGYSPPARETAVLLRNCQRFIDSRCNPATKYVSPQREIDRLREQVNRLSVEASRLVEQVRVLQEHVIELRTCLIGVRNVLPKDKGYLPAVDAALAATSSEKR